MLVVDRFLVKIFRGHDELARLSFHINPRAVLGHVEYTGSTDAALDEIMSTITRVKWWPWPTLCSALIQRLTLSTGGRYIPRFHATPARDGRGTDEVLRKCFKMRAIA